VTASTKIIRKLANPPKSAEPIPAAHLITFAIYGHHFHGDVMGSVDRDHNIPGTSRLPANPNRLRSEQARARQESYTLDRKKRGLVLAAIREVCTHRNWMLRAAHVRSSHVHLVVSAEDAPERVMQDFKAYASRVLKRAGSGDANSKRWARHGSTRYLWNPEQVGAAIHYVVREQGESMAVWEEESQ